VANGDHKRLVLRPAGRNPIGVDPFLVAASRQSAAIPGSDLHRRSAETPLRRASGPNACAKATGGPPRCGIRTVSRGLWTADCGLQTVDRGFTRPAPAAAKPETSTCHNSHPSHKSHCPQVPRLKPRPEDVPPNRTFPCSTQPAYALQCATAYVQSSRHARFARPGRPPRPPPANRPVAPAKRRGRSRADHCQGAPSPQADRRGAADRHLQEQPSLCCIVG